MALLLLTIRAGESPALDDLGVQEVHSTTQTLVALAGGVAASREPQLLSVLTLQRGNESH